MTAAAITMKIPYLCDNISYTLFCITFRKFFSIIKTRDHIRDFFMGAAILDCNALWDLNSVPREFHFVSEVVYKNVQ